MAVRQKEIRSVCQRADECVSICGMCESEREKGKKKKKGEWIWGKWADKSWARESKEWMLKDEQKLDQLL